MKKFLFFFYIVSSMKLFAELPPFVYEELQKSAPEVLLIKVDSIEKNSFIFTDTSVRAEAEVVDVLRSKSGLKNGDQITIVYTTFTSRQKGWVGPSPIPLLEKDKTYRAFLKKSEDEEVYLPAAKGKSFQ